MSTGGLRQKNDEIVLGLCIAYIVMKVDMVTVTDVVDLSHAPGKEKILGGAGSVLLTRKVLKSQRNRNRPLSHLPMYVLVYIHIQIFIVVHISLGTCGTCVERNLIHIDIYTG